MGRHSATEYRLIMTVIVAVCVVGAASAVLPVIELVAGIGVGVLFGLLALAGLAYGLREVRRELLFRAEMRVLDRRNAARLGITRQAAHQRWGHLEPGTRR